MLPLVVEVLVVVVEVTADLLVLTVVVVEEREAPGLEANLPAVEVGGVVVVDVLE